MIEFFPITSVMHLIFTDLHRIVLSYFTSQKFLPKNCFVHMDILLTVNQVTCSSSAVLACLMYMFFLLHQLNCTKSVCTGLGGTHLVLFRVEGNHRLPPTTLSPGDMVCVRICNKRGVGATSCMQGFVNNLGEDGCSITVTFESRHGDPTFSKLFGKSVRIDRIHGLADALTYEVNVYKYSYIL